jgi:hypothetical protein
MDFLNIHFPERVGLPLSDPHRHYAGPAAEKKRTAQIHTRKNSEASGTHATDATIQLSVGIDFTFGFIFLQSFPVAI